MGKRGTSLFTEGNFQLIPKGNNCHSNADIDALYIALQMINLFSIYSPLLKLIDIPYLSESQFRVLQE